MLAEEIRTYVIRPALKIVNLWCPAAELLVYGTGLLETGFTHLYKPNHDGGGFGFYQMAPSVYAENLKFIKAREQRTLAASISGACYYDVIPADHFVLLSNIRFATLLCRIHYLRARADLPEYFNAESMADFYSEHYNNSDGILNRQNNVELFEGIIDAF